MATKSLQKTGEDILNKLRKRIRKDIADVIPDEAINNIIKKELSKFEKVDIPKIIKSELDKKYKELVLEELDKYCGDSWNEEQRRKAREEIERIIIANAPVIFSKLISEPAAFVMTDIKNRLQSMGQNY